ncbi:FCS-Like Zinc finger 10-like [Primulina tabacum]|uniref:FCS-Like Zinc finger 10-like n=1 Tax=Primulina tabacum TaxID=48773 RepID=UPI003F5AA72F
MSDSISESDSHTDNLDQQHKNESYFKVPGLSVGINAKNPESDSVRSPTSTLDFRIFSSTGNPIRSPRSQNEEGQRNSWDCSKVGLSIIDSLDVETTQSGKVLRTSDSKNILFGYQTNVRSSKFSSSSETPKSLPKNVAVFPTNKTKQDNIQKGDSTILFEIEEAPKESFRSCSLNCGKLNLSLTDFGSSKLGSHNLVLENKVNPVPSKFKFLEGSVKSGNSLEGRLSSIPASVHFGTSFFSSVPPSEIELSEDYTCIRNHGPQSKVTHIFCDRILECHDDKLTSFFEKNEDGGMVNSGDLASYPSMDFLKFCYSCKKSLDGEDIFMYRGEKAFCSLSCRSREILVDEEVEKTRANSSEKQRFLNTIVMIDETKA